MSKSNKCFLFYISVSARIFQRAGVGWGLESCFFFSLFSSAKHSALIWGLWASCSVFCAHRAHDKWTSNGLLELLGHQLTEIQAFMASSLTFRYPTTLCSMLFLGQLRNSLCTTKRREMPEDESNKMLALSKFWQSIWDLKTWSSSLLQWWEQHSSHFVLVPARDKIPRKRAEKGF